MVISIQKALFVLALGQLLNLYEYLCTVETKPDLFHFRIRRRCCPPSFGGQRCFSLCYGKD